MPFLNTLGEWAAGVGGGVASWGSASGVGITVWSPAGGTHWLDDNTIIAQHCPAGCVVKTKNIRSNAEATVLDHGANTVSAGGGVWAVWFGTSDPTTVGVTTSAGLRLPSAGLSHTSVGPDGAIAIKRDYQSAGPWDVYERDGTQWVLTEGDAGAIQLLGDKRAVWVEDGEPHTVGGVPVPQPITRPYWWLRMLETPDGWWTLYQESAQGRLLLQDKDGKGYVVGSGNTFQPDLVYVSPHPKIIRVVWATTEGEPPQDVRIRDIEIDSETRIDLGGLPLGPGPETGAPLPQGTITISNMGTFNVAGLANEQIELPPDIFPAYPYESGLGRLIHPTVGTYNYEVKPDEWVNIDADVIVPPVWSSTRTLISAANVLWPGHLRDVVVEERWKALGGLSMPITQLRMLVDMWMRSIDPDVDYVKWYPNYITRVGFKVILLSVNTGGQGSVKFDDVVNYKDEDGNNIGWMTAPVTVVLRLVERL